MLSYLARRAVYTVPILIGVSLVCFALVHIAPGDPLVSVLPPDASADLQKMMLAIYGFDRPYAEQFAKWIWRALHGDL
ncbi:MAG: ABC transporter permease, partial [Microvirga sp.]